MFTITKINQMPKPKNNWQPSQRTLEIRGIVKSLAIGETIKVVFSSTGIGEVRNLASHFYNAAKFVGYKIGLSIDYTSGIGTIYAKRHE